ncbi:hypothetical protein AB4090_06735 [Acidithiobacillus sp. IBUN Pt1247-S3]|uniref:hypothetical protein n=1 Tax=Acidithiobacillus sp. IBUN Pt1247-S3 TaxID=3166642 RepID=UPI0034E58D3A
MTSLPTVEHIQSLHFYGGPKAEHQLTLAQRPDNRLSIQVLYQLAIRHGVISPSGAREVLATLPTEEGAADARSLLQRVLDKGEFLAVRVQR